MAYLQDDVNSRTAREAIIARFPRADLTPKKVFFNESIDKILDSTLFVETTNLVALEAVDPYKAGETGAPSSSGHAAAATNDDKLDPQAVEKDPTVQPGADNSNTTGEGSTVPQGEDAKSGRPPKLTLPMDRARELCTTTGMSSFSVETPVDDAGSPAVGVEEEGSAGTTGKSRKKKSKNKKRGEKNSPRLAFGATGNDVDNPTEQDTKPVIPPVIPNPDPVDVPGGEGDGVLVEKANSSREDSAVFVDAPQAETEVEKAANAAASGSDEWNDWP